MKREKHIIMGVSCDFVTADTLIIGSGAASLSCAEYLHESGCTDLLIVTENMHGGTSANCGSDKQTYYKLSTASPIPDSPYLLAKDLYNGGAVHGDIALTEALVSTEAFYRLVQFGVPFPHNEYGGFTGYRTDHDKRSRATSAGPYTSVIMTDILRNRVKSLDIPCMDRIEIIRLVRQDGRIIGAIGLDLDSDYKDPSFLVFSANNIVMGTGGPAGMYQKSVYPPVHTGSIGLALEIGASAVNLTETQFGMAALDFPWNVSGSFQQVLPSYYSIDSQGQRNCFLEKHFTDFRSMTDAIFLKGYQWPFDSDKTKRKGSSIIDVLVYIETEINGNTVYLDYRENPKWKNTEFSFSLLSKKVRQYLDKSGSTQDTPFERLSHMNRPSVDVCRDHGINLSDSPLKIAVCAQHNNGGLEADVFWESTTIEGLFPVGELTGSHGVYRPGGAALNAGQVGAIRAAKKICTRSKIKKTEQQLSGSAALLDEQLIAMRILARAWLSDNNGRSVYEYRGEFQNRMSRFAGILRGKEISEAINQGMAQARDINNQKVSGMAELVLAYQNRHLVIAHQCYLSAVHDYLEKGGVSRGSALVTDPSGTRICKNASPVIRKKRNGNRYMNMIQKTRYAAGAVYHEWIKTRPIPKKEFWFEKVWKEYREKTHEQSN